MTATATRVALTRAMRSHALKRCYPVSSNMRAHYINPSMEIRSFINQTYPLLSDAAEASKQETFSLADSDTMPPYKRPENMEVSENVEDLFKQMLSLSKADFIKLGHIIMFRLGMTPENLQQMMEAAKAGPAIGKGQAAAAEAAPVIEKTEFDVKLVGFDPKAKIKVIKEVRAITGLGLKEAKELVEGLPKTLEKGIKKEKAEELKQKLEAVGGVIEID